MDNKRLNKILDKQARTLVGKLCKRIEVLERNNKFAPNLYKELSKELVYEQFRDIKTVLNIYSEASVTFVQDKD
jgi:hypothetical protein